MARSQTLSSTSAACSEQSGSSEPRDIPMRSPQQSINDRLPLQRYVQDQQAHERIAVNYAIDRSATHQHLQEWDATFRVSGKGEQRDGGS
ncbi:MAG: hypothetical protein M1827_005517 [Pycnora praestabilis]|nr:MAG: hypothetical protein M1827_005517 [Pycnora praestabilis]